jgi:hypothetical protein
MAEKHHKGGKKNRKHGRNKKWCERYRAENRRAKNKAKRLARHLKHHPNDRQAARAV